MTLSILGLASAASTSASNLSNLASGNFLNAAVQLGSFGFKSFEVPASIDFGASMQHVVHKLPGGRRVIDLLGRDDHAVSWSGTILSPNAMSRVKLLAAIRDAGKGVPLTFGSVRIFVLVTDLSYTYRQANRVEYKIECTVAPEPASATAAGPPDSLLGKLSAAAKSVGDFIQDAQQTVHSYLDPVLSTVDALEGVISPITTALGISIPGLSGLNRLLAGDLSLDVFQNPSNSQGQAYAILDAGLARKQDLIVSSMVATTTVMSTVQASVQAHPQPAVRSQALVTSAADLLAVSSALGTQLICVQTNGSVTSARTQLVLAGQIPTSAYPTLQTATNDLVVLRAPVIASPGQAVQSLLDIDAEGKAAGWTDPLVQDCVTVRLDGQVTVRGSSAAVPVPIAPSASRALAAVPSSSASNLGQVRLAQVGPSDLDVWHLAAALYGNATSGWQIMQSNGMLDPSILAVATLLIPPVVNSDGVPA